MESSKNTVSRYFIIRLSIITLLVLLAVFISSRNYLLFHIAIEAFGIVIIAAILIIAANTYHVSNNHYFMFLAIAFGFIGLFAFVHSLTYKGMDIVPGITANIPTQLYIITKYMTSFTLLFSFRYLDKKLSISKVLITYSLVTLVLFTMVFYWGNFPDCFLQGQGLTPFKIYSEYVNAVISLIIIGSLIKHKSSFHLNVFKNMVYAMLANTLSGLSFTFYINVYGLFNMLGHLLQLISFYFIFRGIVETSLRKPYEFLYFNLSQANEKLQKMNEQLFDYNFKIEIHQQELEAAYEKIHKEIEKARKIHENFLPKDLPKSEQVSFESYYKPAYDLGGDFFNVQKINDKFLIYLVDVSGHGLDGAILNIFIRENINKYLLAFQKENKEVHPKDILDFLIAQYAKEEFPDEYYICMLVGVLDGQNNKFTFSNAGMHISPFVVDGEGILTRLDAPGIPILSDFNFKKFPYVDYSIDLPMKFTILLTTDGLVEESKDGIMYSEERLARILLNNYDKNTREIVEEINLDFYEFIGNRATKDDITYLVIKGKNNWN